MYKLVHTKEKKKKEIAYHSVMQHTLSLFLHNIMYVLNQERDIIIHVILKKKKKKKTQNKIFLSL